MTLGKKIREARKACGLSQEQLALKLCVSRSAVAKWETDKGLPDVGNLKLLARLLDVSVDSLLDDEQAEESGVIRERYRLSAYGRGCKKIQKDRMVQEKFPDAVIYPLLGRREDPQMPQAVESLFSCKDVRQGEQDPEFYLVEYPRRYLFVTVTDEYVVTKNMDGPIRENPFSMDGWCFVKTNYALQK